MKRYLVFVIVLLMPLLASAEVTWTGGVGAGQMIVLDGIKQSSTEKQIASIPGVMSSESIEDKTTYKSFSLGRCWNENFCVEGAYLWGAHFGTNLAINNVGVGVVNVGGSQIDFGTLPANLTMRREADVSAAQLSALWKVPVSDYVDVFGRVGLYDYNVKTTAKILLPGTSIFLAEESEDRGTVPMASIGFDANFLKKLTIRVEGQKTGVVSIFSVLFVYKIK
ncbi:MAG: hypothetical protein UW27_C0003G0013 [Parcubacteria group bacterium GW2011_GWA1_44_13]|nr:MAG: hypothetical protein UW27_C0003G0013 [Parcubacteria group bacterium GW2011_GWA1_44_13]